MNSLLDEILDGSSSEPLNERPYSRTQSAIDSAKGKVKGVFGSGQVEQGAKETGQMANQLWSDFKRYIGKKYGSHPQSVPYGDVAAFFKGNKLDTKFLGNNDRRSFSPKDVGNAILSAARELNTEYGEEQKVQGQEQDNAPQGQGQEQTQPQQQGQGNQPQSSPTSGSGLADQISSLSPEDRAKLLKLIS